MSQKPPHPMPDDFEELDFNIEHEEWNEYEIDNDVKIRGRIFLTKVVRDPYNPNELAFNLSKPIWSVSAPPNQRGQPNIKREGTKIVGEKYEEHPKRSNEPWNVYTLPRTGQKLKIKLTVTEISRFKDIFDENKMPVFDVPSGAAVNISESDPKKGQ